MIGDGSEGGDRDEVSMVLRLRQHNIGYTADDFYSSLQVNT